MSAVTASALLVAACGTSAVGLAAARIAFRRLLFPRPVGPTSCPGDARVLVSTARDGVAVRAIDVAPAGAGRSGTLVYFHGNGETAIDVVPLARLFSDEGLRVVILEYRGYGLSRDSGRPTEAGLYADAEALLALVGGEREAGPFVYWGTSLGAAVAVEMAVRREPAALVLVCPFTSARAVCRHHAPLLPAGLVVHDVFDSVGKASRIGAPALVVHGEADRLVPASMGRALAGRMPRARFVGLPGAGHGIFATHGDDVVREAKALLAGLG